MAIISYLSCDQETRPFLRIQEASINEYVESKMLRVQMNVVESTLNSGVSIRKTKLGQLIEKFNTGDHLVISDVSRLGDFSSSQLLTLIETLVLKRGVCIHLSFLSIVIDSAVVADSNRLLSIIMKSSLDGQEQLAKSIDDTEIELIKASGRNLIETSQRLLAIKNRALERKLEQEVENSSVLGKVISTHRNNLAAFDRLLSKG